MAILNYVHYSLLLLFGIVLSLTFSGLQIQKRKNIITIAITFLACAAVQVITYIYFDEETVWKLYPLICHVPLLLLLAIYYRKNLLTAFSAVSTAYLCCQPAKWIGLLALAITDSETVSLVTRILVLLFVGIITPIHLSPILSKLFNKDMQSVLIFGSVPIVYYLFDYTMGIYTDLWISNYQLVIEFLPFFICIIFILFCFFYYREYEQKLDAEHTKQIIRIKLEQQAKEIEAIKRSEQEIRILRHDMRLVLNTVLMCLKEQDYDKATEMLSSYASSIESAKIEHFCEIDTVNYVLSYFAAKCETDNIKFTYDVKLDACKVDEIMLCSIISNALDNALNALTNTSPSDKWIELVLKNSDNKMLFSVKNPFNEMPQFADDMPISNKIGHGFGTQSIRYMTEKFNGKCQFSVKDNVFITRVII